MDNNTIGLVAYCDGGASPNPGPCGSGVHGYTYRLPAGKEKPTRINAWVATSLGYVLKQEFDKGQYEGVVIDQVFDMAQSHGHGTNNIGEIRAVSLLFSNELISTCNRVHIICDSKLVVNGISEWIPGWIRRNWIKPDGNEVSNREDWEEVNFHVENFKKQGEFSIAWVLGHNQDFGNEKADYMATIAVNWSKNDILKTDEQYFTVDYYKAQHSIHPFVSLKRVYFNTDPSFNTPGLYYQTDGSKEFILGKRSSEAAYSIISLNTPDPIIESAIKAQTSRITNVNTIVYAKVDRLKEQDVCDYIVRYGRHALIEDRRNLNLNFLDKKPLVIEVRAGELPLRAFDTLLQLEEILVEFRDNFIPNGVFFPEGQLYQVHDITDHFFDQKTKKSGKNEINVAELKKSFGVGVKETKINVQIKDGEKLRPVTLILRFAEDIPARNTFKHLEMSNPLIYAISWMDGPNAIRYAIIIKADDGIGIWSNYFANMVLLKK